MSSTIQFRPAGAAMADSPDAAADAGLDALRDGREAEVLPRLDRVAAAHPGHARLHQVIGLLRRELDQLKPALAAFERAAALAPGDARIAHGHARTALEAGLPAKAMFDRAASLAPRDGEVLLGRSAAQFAEGGPEAALPDLEIILGANPGWLPGHSLMARLRWLTGEREHFADSYKRALGTAPGDINLWRDLITTLIHADQYEPALAAIAQGRISAGQHIVFDVNEAVCVAEMGDTATADRLFAKLGTIDDVTVAVRHIRHLLRSGRPDEAIALALPWTGRAEAAMVWPYLSVAWRLTEDPRWQWLEGDERLVRHFDLDELKPGLDTLADRLRMLHNTSHQPLEQSVRGGTQTDGPLFRRIWPEIQALRAAIVRAVEAYVAGLPPVDPTHPFLGVPRDGPVRFAGSWSVRLQKQGHHSNHIHPQGWISSAFYVALPDAAERGPEPAGWLQLGVPQTELGVDLPPTRMIEPKPGRLALFPSTMWHGTVPFEAGERLTAAFDVARGR